jgi:hypothetical protein
MSDRDYTEQTKILQNRCGIYFEASFVVALKRIGNLSHAEFFIL